MAKPKTSMKIIIDLESRPDPKLIDIKLANIKARGNLKDPDKIKADIDEKIAGLRKTLSLDTDYAKIVCIGVRVDEESKTFKTVKEFADWYNPIYHNTDVFIGYNLKKFDLPLLIKQGLKENISLPYRFIQSATKRFKNPNCIDLQEEINGQQEWKSMDELLQIYLGITKKPINFGTCSEEELIIHNLEDLENTEKLYKLFEVIC